jgi:hypothetical protein
MKKRQPRDLATVSVIFVPNAHFLPFFPRENRGQYANNPLCDNDLREIVLNS